MMLPHLRGRLFAHLSTSSATVDRWISQPSCCRSQNFWMCKQHLSIPPQLGRHCASPGTAFWALSSSLLARAGTWVAGQPALLARAFLSSHSLCPDTHPLLGWLGSLFSREAHCCWCCWLCGGAVTAQPRIATPCLSPTSCTAGRSTFSFWPFFQGLSHLPFWQGTRFHLPLPLFGGLPLL